MSDVRGVTVAQLRELIGDAAELAKGTEVADRGGLSHLARHGNKLFAEASGSGPAPYKPQIVFGDEKITGRCSCMAARSRPFCKHAAALLVSWARTPEAFAIAEAPPAAPATGGGRKAAVKGARIDPAEARKKGVDRALTVLSELWQTGVLALAADRAEQVAELAGSLRELGLRRLSVRMLELAELLRLAARRDGSLPEGEWADLVVDTWLTVRKLEKHLAGEPLVEEHVEELVGKTWTKKDRRPIEGLDLVEYAFSQRTTADDFVVRESRLFDLCSGAHYTEKQILPAMIAKRTAPKRSYAGRRLQGASGSVFPSFPPRRLDLEATGAEAALEAPTLQAVLEKAVPSVTAALAALAERRRDVFAPPWVPVLVRTDWLVPSGERLRLLDREGGTLFVGGGRAREEALLAALEGTRALAVFGDVILEGAFPCLVPLAVVGERDGAVQLWSLGGDDASALLDAGREPGRRGEAARRAGVSAAAVLVGEVRDDLAAVFLEGTSGVTPRFVDPLAARLEELSLGKQAEALRAAGRAADATDRLDALVKLHGVLGIALTRLVGTAKVDATGLARLPSMPSVAIPKPSRRLSPREAAAAEARGEIDRFERAYHLDAHYVDVGEEGLLGRADPLWGDGAAVPFVLRAAVARPELAVPVAASLLAGGGDRLRTPVPSRLAKLTAVAILSRSRSTEGQRALRALADAKEDPTLAAHARRALGAAKLTAEDVRRLALEVATASRKEARATAIWTLTEDAAVEAVPAIRAALFDRAADVRRAAAWGLAMLGDLPSLERFVSWVDAQGEDERIGARAIGLLGDARGAGALLSALARGVSPVTVREALALLGPWVLGPLLDLTLEQPELAKRAAVGTLVKEFPREASVPALVSWVEAAANADDQVKRARLALDACSARKDAAEALRDWIREQRADLVEGADEGRRALAKKLKAKTRAPS